MTNPNEKEWYEDEKYFSFEEITVNYPMPNVPAIVAETERRTWEDALSLMEEEGSREIIRIKLSSLTKK